MAPYGVVANLLAMPIVSAWVMPAGLLALVAIPFGFDAPLWSLMAEGIEWMNAVAMWVASFPGAVGRISAFGVGPLIVCTAGLFVLCLLRTPLRWIGATLIGIAIVWIALTPAPDVLIAHGGDTFAVRNASGHFSMVKKGGDAFAMREWLAADADARLPTDSMLGAGIRCDEIGCIGRLADGATVALALHSEAVAEDCRRAALVITSRQVPHDCAATVIDRTMRNQLGAIALRRIDQSWEITPTRPLGHDRPWVRAKSAPAPSATGENQTTPSRAGSRDATPKVEDLTADD
jgi:competence protein ComEC